MEKKKIKCTKKKFEAIICGIHDDLSCRLYDEMLEDRVAKMTLYYSGDRHIGTWQTGSGWYYSEVLAVF